MNQDSPQYSDNQEELVGRCRAQIHRALGRNLPELALVLGSGFQEVLAGFRVLRQIEYSKLAGFPAPAVAGHAGTLCLAELEGLPLVVCAGRAHFYEGHAMDRVMFPVQMLAACGVRQIVLTNAAGGINRNYRAGEFMLLADHINFTGVNPLRAAFRAPAFVDLTHAYSRALRGELALSAARAGVKLRSGVYLGVAGPSYETPAEIRAFRKLGADAVGMSTIPEVLMARACGLEVAAISCITNPAAGLRRRELSHGEVLAKGRESCRNALRLLAEFARARVHKLHRKAERAPRRKYLNKGQPAVGSPSRKR